MTTEQSVKIWNYGTCYSSNNYGAHSIAIQVGGLTLWFSYKTVVAFLDDTRVVNAFVCCENVWSNTTGRHLNLIQPNKKARVPRDEFEKLLDKALAAHKLAI